MKKKITTIFKQKVTTCTCQFQTKSPYITIHISKVKTPKASTKCVTSSFLQPDFYLLNLLALPVDSTWDVKDLKLKISGINMTAIVP